MHSNYSSRMRTLSSLLAFVLLTAVAECDAMQLGNRSNTDAESNNSRHEESSNTICTLPYHPVGDYCLIVDNDIQGTWSQMRSVCLSLEGDLVSLSDANLLYDINNYIRDHGMNKDSYWVGANDLQTEGTWVWAIDDSAVKMEVPLWGHLYGLQPNGGRDENCGALSANEFFYLHDDYCDDAMFGVICQPRYDGKARSPVLEPPNECPPEYMKIGNSCFKIIEDRYTWVEAAEVCAGPKSHLAIINDANLLGELYDYLQQSTGISYLWIGGSDEVDEDSWIWEDSSPLKRGTPFWDVNDEVEQEPAGGSTNNCVFLKRDGFYRFRDGNCASPQGIICQYETT